MLSDDAHRATLPSGKARGKSRKGYHWSDSQKIEAITTYLALGNVALSSRVLKIPEVTLRSWKNSTWWKEMESELRTEENLQMSSRLQKIIESTLAAAEDRIANGDFIYDNRSGQLVRKPVPLRDVHKVSMDMMNRRDDLISQRPANVDMASIDDRLKKLAQKFEEIASGPKPIIEVTDVLIGEEITKEEIMEDTDFGDE